MVRALSFLAVRQEHDQRRALPPLRFCRRNELIDDCLRADRKVTELCFPQDQCLGAFDGIPVFVGKNCILRQRRIEDIEVGLIGSKEVQWSEFAPVIVVVEDRVALNKGRAACIFTGKANRRALHE